ncbi:MAG: WD40 repeat protein [Lasallia pustulata]|uniref:WD40 repeat protein n=1 Tax=Lasallia pustulata TaxID=136370 RepID=A0A5M8PBY2_9LECA|nr:MAG: WD40 repeat protein [Lasallia pustulata]
MARSQCFPSVQHSKPSPHGQFIATLLQFRLLLRSSRNGKLLRMIPLDSDFTARCRYLRWSRGLGPTQEEEAREYLGSETPARCRILLADDDTVRVYDAYDAQWSATITRASSNIGKIANVEFGYTSDEILVFSDFSIKATLWSLITGRGVEIRDPRFANRGYSYRPETGHLAILARPEAHDIVLLLAPGTRELLGNFTLDTVDSQGLLWSPDGRWLVAWDAASSGYKVLVYTADGHLYRTITGGQVVDKIGLGVKSVAWSAGGTYLAVGGYDGRVSLLNTTTFTPKAIFSHPTTISSTRAAIWQEQISASQARTYVPATPPISPPTSSTPLSSADPSLKTGISTLSFCSNTLYLATSCSSTPTTTWIWSLETLSPTAVLIHHSPIKYLHWHPTLPSLLLIHCHTPDSVLHIWQPPPGEPLVMYLPLDALGGPREALWLSTTSRERPKVMLGNARNYIIGSVSDGEGEDTPLFDETGDVISGGPEDMFDEGNSMDLSPVKLSWDVGGVEEGVISGVVGGRGKRVGGGGQGGGYVFVSAWGRYGEVMGRRVGKAVESA